MAVWMGTTMACAQCHTHKYDPITQEEYFRFFAILNNTQDADRRDESPLLQIYTDEQVQQKSDLETQITNLTQIIGTVTPELLASQQQWEDRLRKSPEWKSLIPVSVTRKSGQPAKILDDGAVLVGAVAETDSYTIDIPLGQSDEAKTVAESFAALRLETLPHDSLSAKGAGHIGGNFVVTGLRAQLVPAGNVSPKAQFVRVTNNGKQQILSLAEVSGLQCRQQHRHQRQGDSAVHRVCRPAGICHRRQDGRRLPEAVGDAHGHR